MDAKTITKYLMEGHVHVVVPLDMLGITGADVLAGQDHVKSLLCPKKVQERHDAMKVCYGTRDDFGNHFHFEVTCADVQAGESVVFAKVAAQLAAYISAGMVSTQGGGGPSEPK